MTGWMDGWMERWIIDSDPQTWTDLWDGRLQNPMCGFMSPEQRCRPGQVVFKISYLSWIAFWWPPGHLHIAGVISKLLPWAHALSLQHWVNFMSAWVSPSPQGPSVTLFTVVSAPANQTPHSSYPGPHLLLWFLSPSKVLSNLFIHSVCYLLLYHSMLQCCILNKYTKLLYLYYCNYIILECKSHYVLDT